MIHLGISLIAFALAFSPAWAVEHHYSPEENLEKIDAALLGTATRSIDMAAYVLTDVAIMDALTAASQRGVKVRIYFDPGGGTPHGAVADAAQAMLGSTNVTVRTKLTGPLMHLKAYCLDGATLRTGSANFSASGEKKQDNELVIDRDPQAASDFTAKFERMWARDTE